MDERNKGMKLMLLMGYNRNQGLGQDNNGRVIPIIPEKQIKNLGIGHPTPKVTILGRGAHGR